MIRSFIFAKKLGSGAKVAHVRGFISNATETTLALETSKTTRDVLTSFDLPVTRSALPLIVSFLGHPLFPHIRAPESHKDVHL